MNGLMGKYREEWIRAMDSLAKLTEQVTVYEEALSRIAGRGAAAGMFCNFCEAEDVARGGVDSGEGSIPCLGFVVL